MHHAAVVNSTDDDLEMRASTLVLDMMNIILFLDSDDRQLDTVDSAADTKELYEPMMLVQDNELMVPLECLDLTVPKTSCVSSNR